MVVWRVAFTIWLAGDAANWLDVLVRPFHLPLNGRCFALSEEHWYFNVDSRLAGVYFLFHRRCPLVRRWGELPEFLIAVDILGTNLVFLHLLSLLLEVLEHAYVLLAEDTFDFGDHLVVWSFVRRFFDRLVGCLHCLPAVHAQRKSWPGLRLSLSLECFYFDSRFLSHCILVLLVVVLETLDIVSLQGHQHIWMVVLGWARLICFRPAWLQFSKNSLLLDRSLRLGSLCAIGEMLIFYVENRPLHWAVVIFRAWVVFCS